MPSTNRYEVEQTRSIEVSASSPTDAMLIAHREFSKELKVTEIIPESELQGYVTSPVEVINVDIRKRL